jgi:hypothetical protein
MARFFRVGLSLQKGRQDGPNRAAVAGAPAAAAGDAAARGGPSRHAGADGAAECPRLHRAADCGDLRAGRGRGAGLAAPVPGAGARWAGGPSAAGQAAEGPAGPAHRRCPDAQRSAQQWPGPGVLDRRAACQLPGGAVRAGAVRQQRPPAPARLRLALGTAASGRGHPCPAWTAQGGPGHLAQAAADRAGARLGGDRAVPGRVRPPTAAGGPRHVDERPTRAHPHAPARTPSGPSSGRRTPGREPCTS